MAPLPKFADFGKGFTDELTSKDDFPVGTFNVKVNTTSASRVVSHTTVPLSAHAACGLPRAC